MGSKMKANIFSMLVATPNEKKTLGTLSFSSLSNTILLQKSKNLLGETIIESTHCDLSRASFIKSTSISSRVEK